MNDQFSEFSFYDDTIDHLGARTRKAWITPEQLRDWDARDRGPRDEIDSEHLEWIDARITAAMKSEKIHAVIHEPYFGSRGTYVTLYKDGSPSAFRVGGLDSRDYFGLMPEEAMIWKQGDRCTAADAATVLRWVLSRLESHPLAKPEWISAAKGKLISLTAATKQP